MRQVAVIVQITDVCPECAADHIDIQALTYNKISPMSSGRISIQYRRVECVPPQKIIVSVDNNRGTGGWLRLFVEVCPALIRVCGKRSPQSWLVQATLLLIRVYVLTDMCGEAPTSHHSCSWSCNTPHTRAAPVRGNGGCGSG